MDKEDVKQARKALGLTQAELAEKMGYNGQSYIARLESGDRNISEIGERLLRSLLETQEAGGRVNFNRYFKRISASHRMRKHDVVKCCALGGLEITASRAEGWRRGEHDERRFLAMSEAEFEAFTSGLIKWGIETYEK